MNKALRTLIIVTLAYSGGSAYASEPVCSHSDAPYTDLDFLVGTWEFFSMDGKKIADQTYRKKEEGCLILEDWKTLWGETGTGMHFVDPATNKWRQVWMSPSYHIDYSGGLVSSGNFVLEGMIYPNNGQNSSAVRGVYSKQKDGSVIKEFLKFDENSNVWERFFIGVARKTKGIENEKMKGASPYRDDKLDCPSNQKLVADLAFLPGKYEYFLAGGKKLGETEYTADSNGCIILEKFQYETGETFIGSISFDKKRNKWKHFWVSERITFELFGVVNTNGTLAFEGEVEIHASSKRATMRGAWTVNDDRSIQHTYEIFDKESQSWGPFFSGISKRK